MITNCLQLSEDKALCDPVHGCSSNYTPPHIGSYTAPRNDSFFLTWCLSVYFPNLKEQSTSQAPGTSLSWSAVGKLSRDSESCCCQSSGPCNTCSISQPESSYSWCFQKLVSDFSRTLISETKVRLCGMCWFSLPTLFLKSFPRAHISVESLPTGLPGVSVLRLGNNADLSYLSLWTLRIGPASYHLIFITFARIEKVH